MKAIQTHYKGRIFRSRLEARWACFLDALKVEWDYEPEGFDFGSGFRYLPDFYVPSWNVYIEIKPRLRKKDPERVAARNPCWTLFTNSGTRVLLIFGNPWIGEYEIEPMGWIELAYSTFGQCRKCSNVWLIEDDESRAVMLGTRECRREGDKHPLTGDAAHDIITALRAASSARFEHGESGAPR